MTGEKQNKDTSAGAAGAGLVSFSNKGEIPGEEKKAVPTDKLVAAVNRRLARMRAGVISAAKYISNEMIGDDPTWRAALVTLTYHRSDDWSGAHIKDLLTHYRKWYQRHGVPFRYVWTLEMQKRGAPHYHIVIWIKGGVDKNGDWYGTKKTPPFPDSQGWWPHGSSNAIFAESPVGYIAKYASKGPESRLPKGARIWGHGGLDAAGKFEVARRLAPRWLKGLVSPEAQLKRVVLVFEEARNKGLKALVRVRGFLDQLTGFTFLSPWLYEGFTGPNGLALRHQGFVEAFHEGERYEIPQQRQVFA